MKYLYIGLFAISLLSCSTKPKHEKKAIVEEVGYSLSKASNSVNFTAYKTTKKIPVKGLFKEVVVVNNGVGKTIKEAINGAEFKIPVSSIETNDAGRNVKIEQFFFGVMSKTVDLTGKINIINETTGYVDFVMNDVTKKMAFTYTIKDEIFSMKATMNIDNWNAQSAIHKLNEICEVLHKGDDGISKTWSEVSIEITSKF